MSLRERIKWLAFPGTNLHARLRWRALPLYFGTARPGEQRLVLDAGCGNGMLSYQSCIRGNRVIGLGIKEQELARNRKLFHGLLRIPEERLSFRVMNLYDVGQLGMVFDEIICCEVLEHIVRDRDVCQSFWNILKPGGILHLCCPNADHPDNAAKELDRAESGGHVRPGYTMESYRALLEPLGFSIAESRGLGGPVRQAFNRRVIRTQERLGFLPGLIVFAASLPFLPLDPPEPDIPYSLYVRAVKVRP